jgi:hypothetical protein
MGNFAFDQSFVETFPSMILYSEFDKSGFLSFTYRPVYIAGMIPQPATGRLGREILDRITDYSRELDTVVSVDPIATQGTIHLDPETALWNPFEGEVDVPLVEEVDRWVSIPIERHGPGTLSQILAVEGVGGIEVRVGRELVWQGDFEDEGGNLWNLNSSDEEFDEEIFHQGLRSLRQHRSPQNQGGATTDFRGNPPALGGTEFSICGWVRTENGVDVGIAARLYENRYGGTIGTYEAGQPLVGTNDWTWLSSNIHAPDPANYFEVFCFSERPSSGDAYAWFDEVRLVEWESWQATTLPLQVPYPNNFRFVQVRSSEPADTVRVVWEEMVPEGITVDIAEESSLSDPRFGITRSTPNPFGRSTTIEYLLPRSGKVHIEVFDVSGRRVSVLEEGFRPAGRYQTSFDARDLAAGIYLCRMQIGKEMWTRKLVCLR